jgi:hypothetical protein
MTSDHLKSVFRLWINGIQKHHGVTVGWVRSIEHFPKWHIHAALIAPISIDCNHAAALWETLAALGYSDAAIVKPYQRGLCGLGYILKQLDSPAESIQYSENIAAFAPSSGRSLFRTSSAQRRQIRRIKAEVRRADSKAVLLSQTAPAGGSAPARTTVRKETRQ